MKAESYYFESNEPLGDSDAVKQLSEIIRDHLTKDNLHINEAAHRILSVGGRLRSLSGRVKDRITVCFLTHGRPLCDLELHGGILRMLFARLAVICKKQNAEVSPYGGQAVFPSPVGHPEPITFRLTFTNTQAVQEFNLDVV